MFIKEVFSGDSPVKTTNGELSLIVASGIPTVSGNKKSNSVKVSVQPEHAKYGMGGYCFKDSKLWEIATAAEEKEVPIMIRIEKRRKKGVDVNIPINELTKTTDEAKKNIISALVGIYDFNNKKWILSEDYHANPEDDSSKIKQAIKTAAIGEVEIDTETFFEIPEKKVFVPNPPHFDKQNQLITFYFFIKSLENKYSYELKNEIRKKMAETILKLANEIQKKIKMIDIVDYKDYSHNRARYIIFSYEENIDNLNQEKITNLSKWCKECYSYSCDLIEWSKQ